MSSAVQMKKVSRIIPIELQNSIENGELDIEKFLKDLVSFNSISAKSLPAENIESDAVKSKSITDKIKEKITNKKFEKIRNQLIANALGISLEDLKNYKKDALKLEESNEDSPSDTDADIVRDRRRVWRGQIGSNKNDKKNIMIGTATGLAGVALDSFPALAAIFAAIPGLQQVLIGVSVASLIRAVAIYAKGRKGRIADSTEKERAYLQALAPFMEKINSLESSLLADKDLILEKKKTLDSKEFSNWLQEYAKNLKERLGLDAENKLEELVTE